MPRIRSIKPEFWSDGKNMRLSDSCCLFYIALWNFCDDEGKCRLDYTELVARMGGRWRQEKIKIFVQKLLDSSQLRISLCSGWIQVVNWSNQVINRPVQPKIFASSIQWVIDSDSVSAHVSSVSTHCKDRIGKEYTPLPPEGDVGDWDLGEPGNAARGEPRDQDTLQERSVNDRDAGLNLNNIQPDNQVNESTSQEPPPPKPRSKVKESDFEKVENLIGLWNALKAPEMPAEGLPLNRAGKSQQQFVKRVIKVLEKYPDQSDWKAYIKYLAKQDWARGKSSINFLADFEYLTRLTTIEKHFRKARQQTFLNEYEEVTIYE